MKSPLNRRITMKIRSISQVVYAEIRNMGRLQVRQLLPSPQVDYLDPFVLLHHAHMLYEEVDRIKKITVKKF
jgi:hypothetical protein